MVAVLVLDAVAGVDAVEEGASAAARAILGTAENAGRLSISKVDVFF